MLHLRKASSRCTMLLGVAVLLIFGVMPAQATVVDRGTFEGSDPGVAEEICGIDLVRESTFSGSYRVRLDKASDGQAFFQRLNLQYRDVFTNPINGRSMTFEGRSVRNEISATKVQDDVYAFTEIEAGQPFTVRDGAGNVVQRDRGVIRHHILFDTLGDGAPGGVQLDDQVVGVGGPHPGLDQSDANFCAMIDALVG
jgi:hypothetical protein